MLSSGHSGGIKTWFLFISQKPEVVGGKCFGVFYSITSDLSNGISIIAIGHHSRKLGRQVCPSVCLSVCLFVTLFFRILPQATGHSFRPIKLRFFVSKVQGPT